jgi:DNA mismatch repair ATPase MutS
MRAISRMFHARALSRDAALEAAARTLTERTWRDLGMDAVFARLDRCLTAVGQQALYDRLRTPSFDAARVEAFDRRVAAFSEDAALRDAVREAMTPLHGDAALGLAPLLYGAPPPLPRFASLFPLATLVTAGLAVLSFAWAPAIALLILSVCGNVAVRVALHRRMTEHAEGLRASAGLVAAARALARIAHDAIADDLAEVRRALSGLAAGKRAAAWLTLDALRLGEVEAILVTYLNVFFLLDVNAYARALTVARRSQAALIALLEAIGTIDAARSMASFRAGEPVWCRPTFAPRGVPIDLRGVRHPLVIGAVPNDARIDQAGWLVTGSNMAGKSTFLRAVGLQVVLAQTVATVTCDAYSAPLARVETLILVEDDLRAGRSHFLVEAETARDMLVRVDGAFDRLCLVDELFRGTNTLDRVAAGAAFLRGLIVRGARVIAATHDRELLALLEDTYVPVYFTERVTEGELRFDYRARHGRAAPRNALAVLAMVGFPSDVVNDARACALGAAGAGADVLDEGGA